MLALLALSAFASDSYPLLDAELLALRWLESDAMTLALKKGGKARARYAKTLTEAHAERMERMPAEMAAFERALEREGADGGSAWKERYAADDVRQRALDAGKGFAVLLDELRPGWRSEEGPLDVLLAESLADERLLPLTEDIRHAREEIAALQLKINTRGTDYLSKPGYAVHFEVPLQDDADPLGSVSLKDGAQLFGGSVTFTGRAGALQIERLGAWRNESEIWIAGLSKDELVITHEGDEVVFEAPGLSARLRGAVYDVGDSSALVQAVPGASAEADPAVFALFALATASGYPGSDSKLRDAVKAAGKKCSADIERFRALQQTDHPWLGGMLSRTLTLGDAPGFEVDRDVAELSLAYQRTEAWDELPAVLSSFWRCAGLDALWAEARPEWIELGQQALVRAAGPLAQASKVDPGRWPRVRIVPNPLDRAGRGFSASWGGESSVFLGSWRREPDPGLVVHEALHHVVDPTVRGQACPAVAEAHAAAMKLPALAEAYPDPDVWLAESIVRALTVEAGSWPGGGSAEEAVQRWVGEGLTIVPEVVAGLEREAWDVWFEEKCGEEAF